MNWKKIVLREALTFERLRAMEPREAAAYFVARREEGFSPSEEALLALWLGADEAHARELDSVDRAWAWLADADDHEVLKAMRSHAVQPRRRSWTSWRPAAAAAAAILLVLSAGMLLFLTPDWRGPATNGDAAGDPGIRYATAHGQVRRIELPDGSVMTLDAQSVAVARSGAAGRSVELARGRALFEVAADASRPFSVTAADRRVVAVGTRFDVGLAPGTLTVNLLEGAVTVGPLAEDVTPVRLKPGQQFVERGGRARIRNLGAEVENAVGWKSGLLHFDDDTLGEAVAEVNRYANVQIAIRDADVAAMRVSGMFRAGDSEAFVATVAELRPVRGVRSGDRIELVPAE